MELNELLPGMEEELPRTDVRLRPDMRLLEDGHPMKASISKPKTQCLRFGATRGLPRHSLFLDYGSEGVTVEVAIWRCRCSLLTAPELRERCSPAKSQALTAWSS